MFNVRASIVVALAFVLLSRTALGGELPAAVEGKVTVNGKPLAQGRIFFHIGKGQFIGAFVKDGNYKVDNLPVGKLPVTVEFAGALPMYLDEKKSGLFFDAQAGSSSYDIDLKFK